MYTKSDPGEFAHFVQTQSMNTYKARITPTQTQIKELLGINSDVLTPAHLQTTNIIDDPMLPLADTTKKSLNFDEAIGTDSQLLHDLPDKDKWTLLLRWHYRLGRLPFKTLINLAKQGLINQQLATINEPPLCLGYQYGKQVHRAWRTKENKKLRKRRLHKAKQPGEVVSTDTMNSRSVPGLVAQLQGRPSHQRYRYAAVFVDHYSDLDYVHFHHHNDAASVIEGKLAFKRFAATYDIQIKHYHCDNGIFADTDFKAACQASNQTITYCGVNAHQKCIRDLRDSARSMLLLAQHNWPEAITPHLWGFAMSYASQIRQHTP